MNCVWKLKGLGPGDAGVPVFGTGLGDVRAPLLSIGAESAILFLLYGRRGEDGV